MRKTDIDVWSNGELQKGVNTMVERLRKLHRIEHAWFMLEFSKNLNNFC